MDFSPRRNREIMLHATYSKGNTSAVTTTPMPNVNKINVALDEPSSNRDGSEKIETIA
jgi:hypothetical protein